nr:hypothetical protein [Tanacetum cinerariifolium]
MSSKEVPEEKKVYTEGQRSYWKITRLGGSSASYQFFIDLLKHLDREDLNQLWRLVKETLNNRPPTSDKEMKLWVELSRKGLVLVMISYKLQVENYSQMANDLILKIYKIANSPRQQMQTSSTGATQQLSSGNTSSLAVAKYSSSEIFITGSGNDLSILFPTILP